MGKRKIISRVLSPEDFDDCFSVVTVSEASSMWEVSVPTVWKWINEGAVAYREPFKGQGTIISFQSLVNHAGLPRMVPAYLREHFK